MSEMTHKINFDHLLLEKPCLTANLCTLEVVDALGSRSWL